MPTHERATTRRSTTRRRGARRARLARAALIASAVWGIGQAGMAAETANQVKAELLAETATTHPTEPFWVGVRLTMEPGWHTYWVNPGDAGMATAIRWDLPPGYQAGPIQWPAPQRIEAPPLVSFGYEGEVLLLTQIHPDASVAPGQRIPITAHVQWVVCKDICIKGKADSAIELPVAADTPQPDPGAAAAFAKAKGSLPLPSSPWTFRATNKGSKIILRATSPETFTGSLTDVDFFPELPGVVDHAAPQWIKKMQDGYMIELSRSRFAAQPPRQLRGVLVCREGWLGPDSAGALRLDVPVESGS